MLKHTVNNVPPPQDFMIVSGQWLVVSSHAEISNDYKFESLITIIEPISDCPFRAILVLSVNSHLFRYKK
jgi:hypothetical protein